MKMLALVLVVLVFAGCTMPVTLRHPQTGQLTQCGPYPFPGEVTTAMRETKCIKDYQRQGYERVPE